MGIMKLNTRCMNLSLVQEWKLIADIIATVHMMLARIAEVRMVAVVDVNSMISMTLCGVRIQLTWAPIGQLQELMLMPLLIADSNATSQKGIATHVVPGANRFTTNGVRIQWGLILQMIMTLNARCMNLSLVQELKLIADIIATVHMMLARIAEVRMVAVVDVNSMISMTLC